MHLQPHSPEAEAVRKIRTGVMLVRAELPSRAVLITSVAPQEGKTVVVANLAIALAQAGRKVLLVDADMRKPRLGTLFPGENDGPGLVQLLSTDLGLDAAIRPTDIEHLSFLPCVATAEQPSELLESPRLLTVISAAKARYDFVLFDSPPLLAVTDAVVLASRVDGVVLVVKGGSTPRELLHRGLAMLTEAQAAPAGGVLNLVAMRGRHARNHAYPYQYYHRYYGRGEDA